MQPPPAKQHLAFLDTMRGVAVLMVFAIHALSPGFSRGELPWGTWFRSLDVTRSFWPLVPLTLGWAGVPVFFAVSGFCIHLSFARQPGWRDFFQRRFFRIYPPYFIAVLFFALVYPLTRVDPASADGWKQLESHSLLAHNYYSGTYFGINSAFWSIAVEAQLYLVYPVLFLMASRLGWTRAMLVVAGIEIGLRLLTPVSGLGTDVAWVPSWMKRSPFAFWFSWSLGAFVAERCHRGESQPLRRVNLYLLGFIALLSSFFRPLWNFSFPLFSALAACFIARRLAEGETGTLTPGPVIRHLRKAGMWSYSIYLLHLPLQRGVAELIPRLFPGREFHPFLIFLACFLSWFWIMPLCGLFYRYVEQSGIALGGYLRRRKTKRVAPAS